MENEELKKYIQQANQAGKTDDQIRQELLGAGWEEMQIKDLLTPGRLPTFLKITRSHSKIERNIFIAGAFSVFASISGSLFYTIIVYVNLGNDGICRIDDLTQIMESWNLLPYMLFTSILTLWPVLFLIINFAKIFNKKVLFVSGFMLSYFPALYSISQFLFRGDSFRTCVDNILNILIFIS